MSKGVTFLLTIVFLTASCVIITSIKADSRTITVPDDYPTIATAIGNAADGDTIFVKKGTYEGSKDQTMVINKTLSLIGEKASNTIINLHPLWIEAWFFTYPSYYDSPMKITANDVKISGFTITSDGGAISVAGDRSQIRGNIIKTNLKIENGSFHTIAENTLTNGIQFYGSKSIINSNIVTGLSYGGIEVGGFFNEVYGNTVTGGYKITSGISSSGNGNIIANNTVINCNSGLVIYSSDSSNNFFYSNRIISNVNGIVVQGGNNNTFYANDLLNNSIGAKIGYLEPPETNATLHHNNFEGSVQQVSTSTSRTYIPGVWSEPFYPTGFFDNGKEGNYWSDYTGADSDGDGIGDTPYVIDANRRDDYPLILPFDIYSTPVFVVYPENKTYATSRVPLSFTVYQPTAWIGYGLIGKRT